MVFNFSFLVAIKNMDQYHCFCIPNMFFSMQYLLLDFHNISGFATADLSWGFEWLPITIEVPTNEMLLPPFYYIIRNIDKVPINP